MVATSPQITFKQTTEETLLAPRFYTKSFNAIAEIDISSQEEEPKATIAEMKTDYSYQFFKKTEKCTDRNEKIKAIDSSNTAKIAKLMRKLPLITNVFAYLLHLYLIKPVNTEYL